MSFDDRAQAAAAPGVAIVAALGLERACLTRQSGGTPAWQILQSGPGPERAARCAARALADGAIALVSWGFAGGLAAALRPGALVLASQVRLQGGAVFRVDADWRQRLQSLHDEFEVGDGELLTVRAALATPAAKAAAAASGAVAVDMESAAIAAVAAEGGVPFVALRVIVDAHDDALPPDAERWIDERGNRRFAPALRAVVTPGEWRALWTLRQRYRVASAALERLARIIAARHLLAPPRDS